MSTKIHPVIILGGGITGVTLGRLLQQSGIEEFLILEREELAGGLCRTKVVDDHILDTGGGHFLSSRHAEVYKFIFSHIPLDQFNEFDRVSKIQLHDALIDYPIEYNLWQLPKKKQVEYLTACVESGHLAGLSSPGSFCEWIEWKLGKSIAENYMLPYNRKIWGVEPEEMDIDWLAKIPSYNLKELIRSVVYQESNREHFPSHQKFYYPKEGGYQKIFDAIERPVKNNIVLNEPVIELKRSDQYWIINGKYKARTVLSTIPWKIVENAMGGVAELTDDLQKIRHSSLMVSLHEQPYDHNIHWKYIPDEDIPHHREFYIQNFALDSNPDGVYRETNLKRWSASKNGLFSCENEYAYPIPVKGHTQAADNILAHFSKQDFYGVGRWGQHRYFNSDVCIHEAIKLVDRLLAEGKLRQ